MKNPAIYFFSNVGKRITVFLIWSLSVVGFQSCSDNSSLENINTVEDDPIGQDDDTIAVPTNDVFDFTVNRDESEIELAISQALTIWGQYLETDVTIRVNVVFVPNLPGFLGRSIPNGIKNFEGAPVQDVWYPLSLANAINGSSLRPNEFDMDILITSDANWYFGTDGNPGASQFDFVTVLLHEVCHSLGFGSLSAVNNGLGAFGDFGIDGYIPSFSIPDLEGLPSIYDSYLETAQMENLTNKELFQNDSEELGMALTSDELFFAGMKTEAENQGQRPKIFAPPTFLDGSSISHLDQGTYIMGNPNRLMEPFFIEGEVIHQPGDLILAFLGDIGWTINNVDQ
ncbi:MAG: hypothetical protein AAGF96_19805 [Bacteroidota bacterium]